MEPVGYFQDKISGVVLQFQGAWDLKEMRNHLDYKEVTKKEFDAYNTKQETVKE
jgi:hypothetical protein